MSKKLFLTCAAAIVCRLFLTFLIYEEPLPLQVLSNLPAHFVTLVLWLNVSSQHTCVSLLNCIMDLNLLSLRNVVLSARCCVFYAISHRIYWRFDSDDMTFAITLTWYQKHRETHAGHTGTSILTHSYKYIMTPPVMCAQWLPVLHWMNSFLIQNYFTTVRNLFIVEKLLTCRIHKSAN